MRNLCKSQSSLLAVALVLLLTFLLAEGQMSEQDSCSNAAAANSHLWRVDLPDRPVYLFGTLHMPYAQLWARLPENVKTAFVSSDTFSFELDTQDPVVARQIRNLQFLPPTTTLQQVLLPHMYSRVRRYITRLRPLLRGWISKNAGLFGGFYTDQTLAALLGDWEQRRPVWLLALLNKLNEQFIQRENGHLILDLFLRNAAHALGKQVSWIESAKDQMEPFNQLSLDQVTFALQLQLRLLEDYVLHNKPLPQSVDMVTEYRCGAFNELVERGGVLVDNVCKRNMSSADEGKLESLRQRLMLGLRYQRNKKMAVKVMEKIVQEPNKTHFVAIGAGHLVGNRSVIHYLRLLGYQVDHISCTATIDGPPVPANLVNLGDPSTVPRIIDFSEFSDLFDSTEDQNTFTLDPALLTTPTSPSDTPPGSEGPAPPQLGTGLGHESHSNQSDRQLLQSESNSALPTPLHLVDHSSAVAMTTHAIAVVLCVLLTYLSVPL